MYTCLCASVTPTRSINESVTTEEDMINEELNRERERETQRDKTPMQDERNRKRKEKMDIYMISHASLVIFFEIIGRVLVYDS